MAVLTRKRGGRTTFYVKLKWGGKFIFENAGHEERAARRLNARLLKEIREGRYEPKGPTKATTVWQFMHGWLMRRTNRTVENDWSLIRHHVQPLSWFVSMPIMDVKPKHVIKLVEDLKRSPKIAGGGPIGGKSVSYIYGVVRTMLRDARIAELIAEDPCVLPRGILSRKTASPRKPYEMAEVEAIVGCPAAVDANVWAALALYTGMREGEVCGRRWRDLNLHTAPLACLTVDSQYDGEPLKTDRPRVVPVHPVLEGILTAWRDAFELVHYRKPTPDDFIVPHRNREGREAHTKSSAYKLWRRVLVAAGVQNRSLHSTRHTFISLCRRGGARKDVLERITHNAVGDIVDGYTLWDWKPLCEAVMCFGRGQDSGSTVAGHLSPGNGQNPSDGGPPIPSKPPLLLATPSHPAQCETGHVASHAVTEVAKPQLQRLDSNQSDTGEFGAILPPDHYRAPADDLPGLAEFPKFAAPVTAGLPDSYSFEGLPPSRTAAEEPDIPEGCFWCEYAPGGQRTLTAYNCPLHGNYPAAPTWAAGLPPDVTVDEVLKDLEARPR